LGDARVQQGHQVGAGGFVSVGRGQQSGWLGQGQQMLVLVQDG